MGNSSLVDCTVKSPNNSGKRTHAIDRITPHCTVGQFTAERIGKIFANPLKVASCNYGIGTEGRVVMCVDEENRSWCSSSRSNDQRAVTIECASEKTAPYEFNRNVYAKLIDLCVDICKRNGKKKLVWISDKAKALAYTPKSDEMQLTVHRWFKKKSCPGDWMYSRMGELADIVTARLGGETSFPPTPIAQPEEKEYKNGDVIKLKSGATYYNGKKIPSWVFQSTLYCRGKNSKGIIFSTRKKGAVTGVVKEDMIQ